jgi:hypothetical protein
MNVINGAIGAAIGGLIGTVIWAAVAYFFNVEVGYIAWAIGGLVGFGSAIGTKGGSPTSAIIAVGITVVSICAGKFIAVYLAMSGAAASLAMSPTDLTDEFCTSLIADEICEEKLQRGEQIDWPPGANREMPERRADYPADIWKEASDQWTAMDPAERQQLKDAYIEGLNQALQDMQGQLTLQAFFAQFNFIDIIFFVLAIITAWNLAARDVAVPEPAEPPPST